MAKKKGGRVKVKGYTRVIAVFDGVAKAHARRISVKAHTRKKPKKRKKEA